MIRALALGRKASVAIWIAVMAPGLILATSMGVEVGAWATAQISTQRSADLAAASALSAFSTTGVTSTNAQTVANFAARMAQLNGGTGTASPTWSGTCSATCSSTCTDTLTDNQITAQVIFCGGWQKNTDPMLRVTMQKSVPAYLVFTNGSTHTISATGTAELVTSSSSPTGPGATQPCLLALSTSGTISGQGSTYWTMPNCSVRSNGTITVTGGGGPLNTAGFFANSTITIPNWIATTGTQYPNDGTIPDPYASNTTLQNALTTAGGLTGVTDINCGTVGGVLGTAGQYTGNNNCNGTNALPHGGTCVTSSGVTCTLYPGNYGAFNVPQGGPYTFNFQPGLYLFKGAFTMTNNTTSNGSGVTIISAGAFTGSNSFNFNISAPTPTQVSSTGGIAGIAFASSSSTTAKISGNAAFNIAGVAYFPHATFDASGSSCNSSTPCFGNNSTACLEIIAQSILTTGNSNFNSNCNSFGVTTFTSTSGSTTTIARVTK